VEIDSLGVTPANEELVAKITSVREKIHTAVRKLEALGVGPRDVPAENFDRVAEAIGLLERMNHLYDLGKTLPDDVAQTMSQELDKTEFIARQHIGRMIHHVARASGTETVASLRCRCGSGRTFSECCGSDGGSVG